MDNNIQNINSQPPPIKPYIPPQAQIKKPKKGLVIGMSLGLVFIAAIILILVFLVFPVSGSVGEREPLPILYMEDDEVYLAVGAQTVELEDAAVIHSDYGYDEVNSQISFDRRYFIYLADVDEDTGAGDLMLVDLKGILDPKAIEEDVCSARISALGDYIMFFKDIEDGIGTLYHGRVTGEIKEAADDALPDNYSMSQNSRSYFYLTQRDKDTKELYICKAGGEPEKVREVSLDEGEDLRGIHITDAGVLLYEYIEIDQDTNELESKLYLYKDGENDKYAGDAAIQMVFDSELGKVLYSNGDTLYYKAIGKDKERLTKDFYGVRFKPYYGLDPNYVYDTHFLLAENEDKDNDYPDEVTLYEVRIGSEPIEITEADTWSYNISHNFRWVTFKRDNELCLAYKDLEEWSDRIEICENSMQASFDENSQYLYYIELSEADDEYGDLFRYQLTPREHPPELLQYDVKGFFLYNGAIITITSDNEMYRVYSKDDKEFLFDEEIYDWDYAPDGLYLYTEANNYDIYYVTLNGQAEEICYDAAELLYTNHYITYNVAQAVPEDIIDDLSKTYEDIKYIQDVVNDKEIPEDIDTYKNYKQHMAALEEFVDRNDISDEALEMMDEFYKGFAQLEEYLNSDVGSDEEHMAIESMNTYFNEARELFEKIIGESTVDPLY